MRRFLKILLVKSDVTSPYEIRQNIVSSPFLLEDRNLSSRVPAKESWKVLVISNFTINIFSPEFTASQYEVFNLRGRSPYGMFHFKVWAVSVIVLGQLQFSFYIFILQDVRFRIGKDLILSCPYVKYCIGSNTKH